MQHGICTMVKHRLGSLSSESMLKLLPFLILPRVTSPPHAAVALPPPLATRSSCMEAWSWTLRARTRWGRLTCDVLKAISILSQLYHC
jgi:hypothetical protein